MKSFWKTIKLGMLFCGIFSLVLGFVLIFAPQSVENVLRWILGGGLCLFGLLEIVFVFARPNGLMSVGRMVPGILSLAVGLGFFFRGKIFLELLWMLLGIAVLIDAVYKLQYAFELKAVSFPTWWVNLLTSLTALVFAVVLIITPFSESKSMAIFAGILLAVNGLFDLVSVGWMSWAAKRLKVVATVQIRDAEPQQETGVQPW